VAQAQGDAQRFRSVLTEYQKAPQVTRDRMYTDTMQQVYSNVTKVLVDSRQGSNLLYLPLDKIMQHDAQGRRCRAGEAPLIPGSAFVRRAAAPNFQPAPRCPSRDAARSRERETR
jgi:membrane protease subunit HflK